ncbi:hypothetical protein PSTT_14737 [Puccinia striiformis]|uniref:Uncharacterized protein n=2 Tax=Puccinia striiformis TaxID=27350 RepID=A0A0L0V641_9BASI|nr:hypothetical protein PSTG_12018 [Puccinia striiformis f. sp. tritici PST-78]POV97928.1 hypothetical protein PSTT_14737 [Puccinia striiformis]
MTSTTSKLGSQPSNHPSAGANRSCEALAQSDLANEARHSHPPMILPFNPPITGHNPSTHNTSQPYPHSKPAEKKEIADQHRHCNPPRPPSKTQETCDKSFTSTQLLAAIDLPLTVSTNEPSCYKITAMEYINFDQVPDEDALAQADLPTKENPQEPPVEPPRRSRWRDQ